MSEPRKSSLLRMDNVGIIVENLEAAIAFFVELGLELEGKATVEGEWVDRLIALEGAQCDMAMLRTPDGHSRIELSSFRSPTALGGDANAPVNTLGLRRLMFAVTDLNDVVERLRKHGAELMGEVVDYEAFYRLCYLRGPEGLMIALAEPLKS